MENTVFIIDLYNKFLDPETIRCTFKVNGRTFCIREVKLEWGKPKLDYIDDEFLYFHLYNSLEEAKQYVKQLKQLEGMQL